MLEKWISLLEESGIPYDLHTEDTENPFESCKIVLTVNGVYAICFQYDSGEEMMRIIGNGRV